MKKSILGAIIGGIIIFIWQTLSFVMLQLHRSAEKYTANQDTILTFLHQELRTSGNYMLPNLPDNATMDQHNKMMVDMHGKPFATILYHNTNNQNMTKDMAESFIINVIMVWLLCWILLKINGPTFTDIFISCVFVGLIVFLNMPLTNHVWYWSFGLKANLIDAVASWGLTGIWLGWWLRRS